MRRGGMFATAGVAFAGMLSKRGEGEQGRD
jgi:hypothetical protein